MTLNQHCTVFLPHYKLADDLQKSNLFAYCLSNDRIKHYLPDNAQVEYLERDFLLSVSFLINEKLIYFLDEEYFKKLDKISTQISHFKADPYSNNFELEISNEIGHKLNSYVPLPTNRTKRSRLYTVRKSSVLIKRDENSNQINIGRSSNQRKRDLDNLLRESQLK